MKTRHAACPATFILILASLLAAAGCSKVPGAGQAPDGGTAAVSFYVDDPATRATAAGAEEAVSRLQVLAFDQSGILVQKGESPSGVVTLDLPLKKLTVWAVANGHDNLSDIADERTLRSVRTFFEDNTPSSFEMVGSAQIDFAAASGRSFRIPVDRAAARVHLGSIVFAPASSSFTSVSVTGLYLINVNSSVTFALSGDAPAAAWFNPMGFDADAPAGVRSMTGETLNFTLTESAPHNTAHYFYCYPNATEDDVQGVTPFSIRHTRLVLEGVVGGKTMYWPVTLPQVDANHSYYIPELKITRKGSDNPDVYPANGAADFEIQVSDWDGRDNDGNPFFTPGGKIVTQ